MERGGYKGGGTVGCRWGCAVATIICTPLLFFLILVNTLGDCSVGDACKPRMLWSVFAPVLGIGVVIALSVHALVNWFARRRDRQG